MQEKLSKESIGNRIKKLRIDHKHSQAFIADILKISRSNYSQIEIGNQYPTFETLNIIASYYSKSYDWLLHGSEEGRPNQKPGDKKAIFKELPPPATIRDKRILLVDNLKYPTQLYSTAHLNNLPVIDLPGSFIDNQVNYRAFNIDESEALKHIYRGDILIGKHVDNYAQIALNETYIIVTFSSVLFCRIENIIADSESLACKNGKKNNREFTLAFNDIQEIWQAVCKYSTVIQPVIDTLEDDIQSMGELINKLEREVSKLNRKLTKEKAVA